MANKATRARRRRQREAASDSAAAAVATTSASAAAAVSAAGSASERGSASAAAAGSALEGSPSASAAVAPAAAGVSAAGSASEGSLSASAAPWAAFASLWVGNLHESVTDSQLYDIFSTQGPVDSVRVVRDIVTRGSLGYGYVNYLHPDNAAQALKKLQSAPIKGKLIKIEYSNHNRRWRKSGAIHSLKSGTMDIFFIEDRDKGQDVQQFTQCRSLITSVEVELYDQSTKNRRVLTDVGRRILRGIMSLFLKAHIGDKAFKNDVGIGDLLVFGIRNEQGSIVPGTESVYPGLEVETIDLTNETQKADYLKLLKIIRHIFKKEEYPMHVESIDSMLEDLSGESPPIVDPVRRTRLLQAFAAMIEPAVMASMWWDLVRFYDSLRGPQRRAFRNAVSSTQYANWGNIVRHHRLFRPTYNRCRRDCVCTPNLPHTSYQYHDEMDLLYFARNWFTHVEREQKDAPLKGLIPDLAYIFTHHFGTFMPDLLVQLSINFDLTQILVPLP